MRIAGNEVKDVTRTTAKVGCTIVTREEAVALIAEMDKVQIGPDFKITSESNSEHYINFTINHNGTGWVSSSAKSDGGHYGELNGFGVIRTLGLCLRRDQAKKLRDFLSQQLMGEGPYIVEFREQPSGKWNRSGNKGASQEFELLHEAEDAANEQQRAMGGSYEYRAVPKVR